MRSFDLRAHSPSKQCMTYFFWLALNWSYKERVRISNAYIKWFEFVIRFKFTAKQCYTVFGCFVLSAFFAFKRCVASCFVVVVISRWGSNWLEYVWLLLLLLSIVRCFFFLHFKISFANRNILLACRNIIFNRLYISIFGFQIHFEFDVLETKQQQQKKKKKHKTKRKNNINFALWLDNGMPYNKTRKIDEKTTTALCHGAKVSRRRRRRKKIKNSLHIDRESENQ